MTITRALIEGLLGGGRYPAAPVELVAELRRAGADVDVLAALAGLPARRYVSANDVAETLFPTEPGRDAHAAPPTPPPGRDGPPGGDRYTATSA